MGVFGLQLVLTMIIASFLHKLAPYYSLGRWLLTANLHRCLSPSDKVLRPHVSAPANSNKTTKKKASQRVKILSSPSSTPAEIAAAINSSSNSLDQNLAIPKSANIQLIESPLTWDNMDILHFSGELEFLLNLTFATLVVFVSTCLYYNFRPAAAMEYNLSVMWVLVVMGYAYKLLFSLTHVYVQEELAHQRSLCVVFTSFLFVLALVVLLVDESILNFGLEKSHRDLCDSLSNLLEGFLGEQSDKGVPVVPMWVFKIFLAFFSGLLSMILVFPGFRFADTHFVTISNNTRTPLFKTCLHANYIAPMLCLSLWIQPLTQNMVVENNNIHLFGLMTVGYGTFRVIVLLSVCLLRLSLFRTYFRVTLIPPSGRWLTCGMSREESQS